MATPNGVRGRVLPYDIEDPSSYGDAVFVHPLCHPQRPWQLWSSSKLTVIPDER